MTDTPDPSRLLASAALDNEVTADERAQVDASESLTAEVATYRALRRGLADVDVPAGAREAGIGAALAVFDAAMIDVGPSDTGLIDVNPNDAETRSNVVVSMQTRRRQQFRWLAGLAAAAIVAVVGIVVVNANNSPSKNLSSTAAPAPRVDSPSSNEKSSDQSGKQPDATSAIDSSADGAQPGPGADSANGTAATASPVAATASVAPNAGAASAPAAGTDPWVDAPSFDGAAALAAFAFAPGSPLSQAADSTAGTVTSAHPTADSTAESTPGSTASSTGGATASTPAFPVFQTTTNPARSPATSAAASATTASATPTPATPTAATPTAATAAAGAATAPPQPVDSILIEHADAVCNTRGHPTIAAIYVGKRVIIVRDDVTHQLQILDPQTCAITSTIAVP